ncbi:MAG: polymer-forming cytoskeletal protein [Alphaproteobacteria bacterium]|nr:polymer-forming cytoskeletal protein [Alphaproteobacteria bacterium]
MSKAEERPLAALLGQGARFEGDLAFDGRVRLDGTWVGSLRSTESVEVGISGRVEGTLEAREVILAGQVSGRLVATTRLTLEASARVQGEVQALELVVRPGATIDATLRSGGSTSDT